MILKKKYLGQDSGAIASLNKILISNKSLKYLDLSENELGVYNNNNKQTKSNQTLKLLIQILKIGLIANQGIEVLDLSFNKFNNEKNNLLALDEIIFENKKIKRINLDCNSIDSNELFNEISKISKSDCLGDLKKKISLRYNNDKNMSILEEMNNPQKMNENGKKNLPTTYSINLIEYKLTVIKHLLINNQLINQFYMNEIRYLIDGLDCSNRIFLSFIYELCKELYKTQKDIQKKNLILWTAVKLHIRINYDDQKILKECGFELKNLNQEDLKQYAKFLNGNK